MPLALLATSFLLLRVLLVHTDLSTALSDHTLQAKHDPPPAWSSGGEEQEQEQGDEEIEIPTKIVESTTTNQTSPYSFSKNLTGWVFL